jgi:hypothetical protein
VSPAAEGGRLYLGDLQETEHGVSGRVFGLPPDTLLIRDFSFDGQVADTHLWAGDAGDTQFRRIDDCRSAGSYQ